MKISYRTHPALRYLEKGISWDIPFYKADHDFFKEVRFKFMKNFDFHLDKFNSEINYISEPFFKRASENIDKLMPLYKDIMKNNLSDLLISGAYVFRDAVHFIYHDYKKNTEDGELFYFIFHKNGCPLATYIDSVKYKIYQNEWMSNDIVTNGHPNVKVNLFFCMLFFMFKKYAEVETKELKPHSKLKDVNCKYVNDTGLNITWLDSKWFTTLVKSDAFTVRGHFRLQPYKNENREWTHKLIWISEFEKSGYTAPARKLSLQNNS